MFCNCCEKFENSKWPPFLARQNVFENWHGYSAVCRDTLWVKNFVEIALSSRVFRDISIFMFCNFCEKFENSKWPPSLAWQNFFENRHFYSAEIPCGSKISSKSLYLVRFSRYKHFYVLQFLRKIRKFKMAATFWRDKIFFQNWDSYSAEIPCGSKISSKSLYLARFSRYKHFCVFLIWKIHND